MNSRSKTFVNKFAIKSIAFIFISFFIGHIAQAQKKQKVEKPKANKVDEKGKMMVGMYAGFSLTGLLFESDRDDDTINYLANSSSAIQFTFDKFIKPKLSFGAHASIQSFKVDVNFWKYGNIVNPTEVNDFQAKMKRIYIGGRLLYHFKNTTKMDIYSGVRIGFVTWITNIPVSDPEFRPEFEKPFPMYNRPAVGLVPIGFRVKFTPQISANFELNSGAPHVFCIGGSYVF